MNSLLLTLARLAFLFFWTSQQLLSWFPIPSSLITSEYAALTGVTHSWFQSYLDNRTHYVTFGDSFMLLPCSSQGSVLGPLLFIILVRSSTTMGWTFTAVLMVYSFISANPPISSFLCPLSIAWKTSKPACHPTVLSSITIKLNSWFPLPTTALESGWFLLGMDGCSISPSLEVCNLGIILDYTLSFQSHIKFMSKFAFYSLKDTPRLRALLSDSAAETLIHVLNLLLPGLLQQCRLVCPIKNWTSCRMCRIQLPEFSLAILAAHHPHSHVPSLAPGEVLYLLQNPPLVPSTHQTFFSPTVHSGFCGSHKGLLSFF